MIRIGAMARMFNAGDWIAAVVVATALMWVSWNTAGNAWNSAVDHWNLVVGSLQPPLDDADLARADVVAQRSMNTAAWWMVAITAIATLVGAASLYLIFRTLLEARRSADAAERAVATALQASVSNFELGRQQIRAHASIVGATLHKVTQNLYKLSFGYLNAGQTPAREVWVSFRISLVRNSNEAVADSLLQAGQKSRSDLPHNSERQASFSLAPATVALIKEAEARRQEFCLVCDFGIEYEDVVVPNQKHFVVNRYYSYFRAPLAAQADYTLFRTRADWNYPIGGDA